MNKEVTIQVSPWLAKKRGLLAREFKGVIEKETSKAVFVRGHLYCKPTSTCMRCGRVLTNPISLKVGFGPVCSAELGIPWIASEEEIEHFIKKIEEIKYEGWFPKGMIKIIGDYTASNSEEGEEMVFVEGIKVKGYNKRAEKPPRKRVDIEDNQLEIYFPYDEHLISIMRNYHGSFNRKKKCWVFSISFDLIKSLMEELKDEQFAFSFDLLEQLKVIKEKEEKSRELSKASSSDFTIPGLKQELYPFQRAGVEFMELHNGRVLVADQMGLGKSAQSLAWLQLHPELRPAVILCPAFLKLNWEREINKWLPATDYNRYVILEGTPDPIKLQLISDSSPSIFIINYDILNRWLEFLKNLKVKVLVCDEIHYIKNSKAQRTKATLNLGKGIPHIIGLSGTPLINRPIELWTTLNLITPGQWGNLISYAKRYCNAYYNGFGWDFTGASNLDELNDKLRQRLMIRRIKSDVLKELPPKQRTPLYVEITNYKEYKLLEVDFSKWLRQQGFSQEEIIKSLLGRALSKIEYMKQVCVKGKLDIIVQWIEDFLSITEEKLVVFTHHRDVATSIGKKFKNLSVVLLGEEDKKKRDEKVTRFQTDNNCRLFIGSMQATGMGINLTASSTVVFTELGWTPGLHEQCEDRCHRIGSDITKPINIYYFLGKNTIDERIYDLLQKKSEILRSTLGDEYKNDDLNLVTEVIKSYLQ